MKWLVIGGIGIFAAMFGPLAYSEKARFDAQRDIVVACYQAGQPDCQKLWHD